MKITAGWLDTRKEARNRPRERQEITVDGHKGMMAWVYPSGEVVFVYRYTPPGGAGRKKMRLGQYGESGLTLAEAFDLHRDAERDLEKGFDPVEERERREAEKVLAKQERAGADTVATLVEQFVHQKLRGERWEEQGQQWVRESRANIKVRKRPDEAGALLGYYAEKSRRKPKGRRNNVPTLISELGQLKAREVTRKQLIAFLDDIVQRGAPVTANRVYSLIVQMFTWAVSKDLVPASPMAAIERPGGDERPRDRVLTADEVRTFWTKLDKADMAEPTRLALKLLLATGQRRGELTFAKWSHFDLEDKLWTIPVELLKSSHARRSTAEAHQVPISPLAIDILGKLKELSGSSPYVLPARADKRKKGSYSERVLSRAVRENAKHFGIKHFTPHDLRRTAANFMTKLKIPRLHVEKVLNHSTGDIAEVYDRHDYLVEKRAALETWAKHLQAVIDGRDTRVVAMVRHG